MFGETFSCYMELWTFHTTQPDCRAVAWPCSFNFGLLPLTWHKQLEVICGVKIINEVKVVQFQYHLPLNTLPYLSQTRIKIRLPGLAKMFQLQYIISTYVHQKFWTLNIPYMFNLCDANSYYRSLKMRPKNEVARTLVDPLPSFGMQYLYEVFCQRIYIKSYNFTIQSSPIIF